MARSQNGWSANDRSVINTKTVPGTNVRLPVRKGAAGDLLIEVALAWHRLVEPLVIPGCWGYAERAIRGSSTTLSNHASGTAIDCNAPKHPLAVRGTFTASQRSQLQKIAAVTGNVVRFGEFYTGRVDGMHAEINDGRTEADCARALDALRKFNGSGGTTVTPANGGPVTREENDVLVQAPIYWDANRNFRTTCKAEAGAGSVFSGGWAFVSATWGALTDVRVFAHDGKGRTWGPYAPAGGTVQNNTEFMQPLPAGTRYFTAEGRAANQSSIATVSAICKPA